MTILSEGKERMNKKLTSFSKLWNRTGKQLFEDINWRDYNLVELKDKEGRVVAYNIPTTVEEIGEINIEDLVSDIEILKQEILKQKILQKKLRSRRGPSAAPARRPLRQSSLSVEGTQVTPPRDRSEVNPEDSMFPPIRGVRGGGSRIRKSTNRNVKRTNRKVKRTNRKVKRNNRNVKRTNRKVKRTNRKVKRNNRKVKRTNRKVKRTNRKVKRTNRKVKRTNRKLKWTNHDVKNNN